MKVVHILRKYDPSEWGGTETAVLGLCEGLRTQGAQSIVFAPHTPRRVFADPLVAAGATIRRYDAVLPIWGLAAGKPRALTAVGGNLISYDLFWRLWRERGATVIHSHTLGRLGAIARLAARLKRIPFVVSVHGPVYNLPPSLAERYRPRRGGWDWGRACGALLGSRRLLDHADAVLTGNPEAAALVQRFHPQQRVIVHPHGIDLHGFQCDHRWEAEAAFPETRGREIVLTVGRIDPAKNQAWLIEQWPETLRRHPNARLFLVGGATDADYLSALRTRIRALGLQDDVGIVGVLPPRDPGLIGLMQSARAMILPSLAESVGLVILEAWAAGMPVLAARNPGASSLIEHGRSGLIFDLNDPAAYQNHLSSLLADKEQARRLAAAGHERVQAYDGARLAQRITRLYIELSGAGRASMRSTRRSEEPIPASTA